MAAPIGPGDWVECVDAGPARSGRACPELVVGALYLVERIDIGHYGSGCVYLVGHPSPDEGRALAGWGSAFTCRGYDVARFRPIYRPDATLITRLLEPVPADQEPVKHEGGSR